MTRSDHETALGGLMLGMSLPTLAFGAALLAGMAESLGLIHGTLALGFGALITVGAVLQGLSGATLLWAHRFELGARPQRSAPVKRSVTAPPPMRPTPEPLAALPLVRRVSRPAVPLRPPPPQPRVRARARQALASRSPPAQVRRKTIPLNRSR